MSSHGFGANGVHLLLQDPHATKQLHQILDQDTLQRAHRLLDLARERIVNAISDPERKG
jgi:hypothetical protein